MCKNDIKGVHYDKFFFNLLTTGIKRIFLMLTMPFFKTYPAAPELQGLVRDIQVLHIEWKPGVELPPSFITCLANTEQNLYFSPHDPIKTVTAGRQELTVPPVAISVDVT
jgi:hypothetical protein